MQKKRVKGAFIMLIEDFWIDVVVFVVTGIYKDKKEFVKFIAIRHVFGKNEIKKLIMSNDQSIQSIESIDEWLECLLLK